MGFATKPQIARRMIARAIAAKVPFSFVAADSVYGTGDIETVLRKAGKGYVLGVASNHVFHSWGKNQLIGGTAAKIARESSTQTPGGAYRQAKEPKVRACMTGPISNWPISMPSNTTAPSPGSGREVCLIRRNIADGDLAFFSTWCPKGTPMEKLVSVEGRRWAIEDSFEAAKNELGLDHNETRSWHGWHRHVSLVMLAFAMMAVIRHQANVGAPKKTTRRLRTRHS